MDRMRKREPKQLERKIEIWLMRNRRSLTVQLAGRFARSSC